MTPTANLPGSNSGGTPNQSNTANEQTKQFKSSGHAGNHVVLQCGEQGQLLESVAENGPIDRALRRRPAATIRARSRT